MNEKSFLGGPYEIGDSGHHDTPSSTWIFAKPVALLYKDRKKRDSPVCARGLAPLGTVPFLLSTTATLRRHRNVFRHPPHGNAFALC